MSKSPRGPSEPTRGDAAAKFVFEWVIIASFPITIPLLVVLALTKAYQHSALSAPLPTVAVTGYAIAVTYAFLFNLRITDWTRSGVNFRVLLGQTFRYGRIVIVGFSLITIALASLIEKAPPIEQMVQSDAVFVWSLYLAVTAVVLAGVSVVFKTFPKRRSK